MPLARAVVGGGVLASGLAWRTPAFLEALVAIKRDVPELLVAAGTLLSPEQVHRVQAAGADFGVSPGLSVAVLEEARKCQFPFMPGVQTASDLHRAIELGCRWLKYFPAESAGGLAHLRNLHAPFAHLGLRYLPLGGINESNVAAYLNERPVAAVGGSWIAPAESVSQRAWEKIRQRAVAARALVERAGNGGGA